MAIRRQTVERAVGMLRHWMGLTHFQTCGLRYAATETRLHVLVYNLELVIRILGVAETMRAMKLAGE